MLIVGRGPNRVQYFVGNFNGKAFVTDKKLADYLSFGQGIKGLFLKISKAKPKMAKVSGRA